ncbi:stage II sporulation protein M [Bacillus pseudomycoides]|uniref:stage II sporulation protein M n=1 Tax=Bacillus TaxID=1386 RepID=UPI0003794597|nr:MULTISPECIES: stage II sporulation protein M [Bacillus]AIK40321.1 stage II sporulation protein M [Bacillus pseudomycoides]AJI17302.1 stage II sporulation protein M [Bacillus pseudomycoides]MCX2825593.1 stage II sporulation protein M [Bacillus sp. DHT2]MDR4918292.1 stage II sporulation protein M [Bacillus pseudomycoides]MED4652319.1 stage II sporulation protein M [Bacillus pseudomycoides]
MLRKTWQNRVISHIQENSSLYIFVSVLLLMGVVFGAILVNSLQVNQKQDLSFYLNRFFGQVSKGEFAIASEMFRESYFSQLKYIGFIWLLGISIIGLPLIFILLFLKGVVVGFTVGFLVSQHGWNGLLLAFVSVLPQNLIIIPAFLVMTTVAASFSLRMIRHQFIRKINEPLLPMLIRYTCFFLIIGVILAIASSIEVYASPVLMKEVVESINKK